MHVCTHAHVFVALYLRKFVCPDPLIFSTLIHFFSFLHCFQVHSHEFDSEFRNQMIFATPNEARSVFLFLHQPPPYVSALILFLCPLPQSDGESAAQDAQK